MNSKKGAIGEGVIMIYRMLVITFVAFVILGVSSVFYVHYIDVRDAEARIMAKDVVDCVAPAGVLDLSFFSEEDRDSILSYCGFDKNEVERFYVKILVKEGDDRSVELFQGDSGATWVLKISKEKFFEGEMGKYKPGYFSETYPVYVLKDGDKIEGNMEVEVFVGDEF